ESLAVGAIANRRRALELRRAVRNGFGVEVEIVRRSLGGQRNTLFARAPKRLEPVRRGEMDDVRVRRGCLRHRIDQRDGFIFRLSRTRGEVAGVRTLVTGRSMDVLRQLRMNQQRRTGSVQSVQSLFQSARIDMPKLRHTGVDEKAFEPARPGIE